MNKRKSKDEENGGIHTALDDENCSSGESQESLNSKIYENSQAEGFS